MSEEPAKKVVKKASDLWYKHPAVMQALGIIVILVVVGALIYLLVKGQKKEEGKKE